LNFGDDIAVQVCQISLNQTKQYKILNVKLSFCLKTFW